jgi:hypothetical protein
VTGRWRVGGHWGRTIIIEGDGPPDGQGRRPGDELVGVMDTPELAAEVVAAVNQPAMTEPATATIVATAYGDWIRETTWSEWDLDATGLTLLYEDDWCQEDSAAGRDTVILQSKDGRVWHVRINLDVAEQTVRTPIPDPFDDPAETAGLPT